MVKKILRKINNIDVIAYFNYKILSIENSAESLADLICFFKDRYVLSTAFGGPDGLKTLKNANSGFNLIIINIAMIEITSVTKIIKDSFAVTPVVAMIDSAYSSEAPIAELKADLVIVKPAKMEELDCFIINSLLEERWLRVRQFVIQKRAIHCGFYRTNLTDVGLAR